MPPVIYFGPPKTSSTCLYHAFTAFPNYLQVGTKEWVYLLPLDVLGELDYADRFGRLHGTRAFMKWWKNIYVSYIEHLKHFVQHPSSEYCQAQLEHGHHLIFDRHSVENYLGLFGVGEGRFTVDFCVRNVAVSKQLVSQIKSKAPDAIFLVGMRPFLPLLVSRMHEHFVWFSESKTHIAEIAIDEARVNDSEIVRFSDLLNEALDHLCEFYSDGRAVAVSETETRARWLGSKDAVEATGLVEPADVRYARSMAHGMYITTNYVDIIAKLDSNPEQAIFFNSVKVPHFLNELEPELRRRGLGTGGFIAQKKTPRIRESSASVVDRLLAHDAISGKLQAIVHAAKGFFRKRVDARTFEFLFPDTRYDAKGLCLEMLREMDSSPKPIIVAQPQLEGS